MRCTITPGAARGTVRIPTSKSIAHRLLIVASLTKGTSVIHGLPMNEDILATIDCLRAMGIQIDLQGNSATITGIRGSELGMCCEEGCTLPCRESGSTLRFMIPIAWLTGRTCVFSGAKRLFARPLSVYRDIAGKYGFAWHEQENSLTTCGKMSAGEYCFPGNISSQFVTGLMLAMPHLEHESVISLSEKAESSSYVDLTIEALEAFGYNVIKNSNQYYRVKEGAEGKAVIMTVPGDHSGAAFFGALNTLGGNLELTGIDDNSRQGDRVWKQYFEAIGLGDCELDISDCPDLGPILMALAALKDGVTLKGTSRLRLKESDRGSAMIEELSKCGVHAEQKGNSIRIMKSELHTPSVPFSSHNDHRIAMSLAIVSTITGGTIEGAESVKKSMPEFWQLLAEAGISVTKDEEV